MEGDNKAGRRANEHVAVGRQLRSINMETGALIGVLAAVVIILAMMGFTVAYTLLNKKRKKKQLTDFERYTEGENEVIVVERMRKNE